MSLQISDSLQLGLDVVTDTFGVLGKKGSGKTSMLIVLLEEMFAAGVPVVSVDPKGDHYGIRSSADGKGPGLPIPVLGGRHGDIPLEPTAGAVVADLILAERLSCVLDVSEFSRADVIRFLLAFAQRLYREATNEPLHLLLEECHEYMPQVVRGEDAALVGAWQRLVKQGRFKGIGVTLASQRSAAVNKDVLEQVDNLIVMRTTGPRDRAAIKGWIDTHADSAEILHTLPSLRNGEAWLWQPEKGEPVRFQARMRHTYDAGATPKVGQERRPPSTLADVDLGAIKERMAETIEKAQAEDPKVLRKEIADLRRKLRAANEQVDSLAEASVVSVVEQVEVPVLDAALVIRLEELLQPAAALLGEVQEHLRWRVEDNEGDMSFSRVLAKESGGQQDDRQDVPGGGPAGDGAGGDAAGGAPAGHAHVNQVSTARRRRALAEPDERADPPAGRKSRGAPVPGAAEGVKLGKAERLILTALAQHPEGRTRAQLAFLAGYHPRSKGFTNALSSLRSAGYVNVGELWSITGSGLAALGNWEPSGDPVEYWMAKLGLAEQGILRALLACYPTVLANDELAARTMSSTGSPYHPRSKGFTNAVSKLRSLGLVEGPRGLAGASEELFG